MALLIAAKRDEMYSFIYFIFYALWYLDTS